MSEIPAPASPPPAATASGPPPRPASPSSTWPPSPASRFSASRGRASPSPSPRITSGCSRSPRASTATSRTRRTASGAFRSSSSPFSARRPRRRASCGGPRTTGTTTSTPTRRRTSTARSRTASGGATSGGSCRAATTGRTSPASRTSRSSPSSAGWTATSTPRRWSTRSLTWLVFGWTGLVWGYFVATVFLWHGTFTINSIMHVFGRQVFPTTDTSRNSMIFALVTMGEGWHNNHHFYPSSAAQGFRWWQLDASYYLLWVGEKLGVVKSLRRAPTAAVIARLTSGAGAVASPAHLASDAADALAARWEEIRSAASVAAHQALVDLEAARLNASARLERLQEDYAAARARAGAAAELKLEELRTEIERRAARPARNAPAARRTGGGAGPRARLRRSTWPDLYARTPRPPRRVDGAGPRRDRLRPDGRPLGRAVHVLRRRQRRAVPPDADVRALGARRGSLSPPRHRPREETAPRARAAAGLLVRPAGSGARLRGARVRRRGRLDVRGRVEGARERLRAHGVRGRRRRGGRRARLPSPEPEPEGPRGPAGLGALVQVRLGGRAGRRREREGRARLPRDREGVPRGRLRDGAPPRVPHGDRRRGGGSPLHLDRRARRPVGDAPLPRQAREAARPVEGAPRRRGRHGERLRLRHHAHVREGRRRARLRAAPRRDEGPAGEALPRGPARRSTTATSTCARRSTSASSSARSAS